MIVSRKRLETGTHTDGVSHASYASRCDLVALRLTVLAGLMSLNMLYYAATVKGETRPCCIRISTSQIYVIFLADPSVYGSL